MSDERTRVTAGSSLVLLLSGLVLFGAGAFLWRAGDAVGLDPLSQRGAMRTLHELGDGLVWFLLACGAGGVFYGGRGLFLGR